MHGPDTIFTHYGGDLNVDHCITFRAVLTACRPRVNCSVKHVYPFEVPSSTEWSFGTILRPFCPNVFVGIDDTLSTKLEAMQMYQSENTEYSDPRSIKAICALAHLRGATSGTRATEAFELVYSIEPS